MTREALFSSAGSCLIVIDVQSSFIAKLPEASRAPLLGRIAWLCRVARALDIPTIVTAEEMAAEGPPVAEVMAALAPGQTVFDKHVFGLMGQPDISAAVTATGRSEFVLVGLETDVCVCHSALGLMDRGWRVAIPQDAVATPPESQGPGLNRLEKAGAVLTSTKGVYYEWVRDLPTHYGVIPALREHCPPDLTL